jgi:FKBP-type peptidyl-prolyl cis-trans isomerase 2
MEIKKGSKVTLDYEGRLEDGTIFDTSKHGDHSHPLEFEAGSGQVIKGFDEAVVGMKNGEEKEFEIAKEDAYGEYNEELKRDIPRSVLPKDQKPKAGMTLVMQAPNGQQIPARIDSVDDEKIVLDLNHPLAGKKLIFKIKIVDVQ